MKKSKFRTDLALESADTGDKKLPKGVFVEETAIGNITKTVVEINTPQASFRLKRKEGRYITLEGDFFYKEEFISLLEKEIAQMLPKGKILVSGLGNINITPDSLGPLSAEKIMATSHLPDSFKREFFPKGLREVSVIFPFSSGQTGIETASLINAAVKSENIDGIVAIDALAAMSSKHLGRTVQLSSCGISPGSGVGNRRKEISLSTMGVPCISLGIPTVADAFTVSGGKNIHDNMLLTSKDIDSIIKRGSEIIGEALNFALQDKVDKNSLRLLM